MNWRDYITQCVICGNPLREGRILTCSTECHHIRRGWAIYDRDKNEKLKKGLFKRSWDNGFSDKCVTEKDRRNALPPMKRAELDKLVTDYLSKGGTITRATGRKTWIQYTLKDVETINRIFEQMGIKPMTNPGPYLILHKVRGEPEFDIAIPLQIGNEEGWIIPTSGHRAYPAKAWRLAELNVPPFEAFTTGTNWDQLPDHYQVNGGDAPAMSMEQFFTQLGVEKPKHQTVTRRV